MNRNRQNFSQDRKNFHRNRLTMKVSGISMKVFAFTIAHRCAMICGVMLTGAELTLRLALPPSVVISSLRDLLLNYV